jgi:hypothetical protein
MPPKDEKTIRDRNPNERNNPNEYNNNSENDIDKNIKKFRSAE